MLRKNISAYFDDYVHLIIVCICAGSTHNILKMNSISCQGWLNMKWMKKKVERTLLHFLLIGLCLNEIVPWPPIQRLVVLFFSFYQTEAVYGQGDIYIFELCMSLNKSV